MCIDGSEDVMYQLDGVLRIPATLQIDDKNVNKYAIRVLRNITISECMN